MVRYLLALLAGALLALGAMGLGLVVLRASGALPPPQLSNSLCMDEKLGLMIDAPPRDPDLLVVGSSVAWRHFNGPVAAAMRPGVKLYNAGFCGAEISHTEQVTKWLTGRMPSVRNVLLIASPFDFDDCTVATRSRFAIDDADSLIFGRAWRIPYYARYFDPATFARNARQVARLRDDWRSFDSLVQDRFGDAPIDPAGSRGLHYGEVKRFDPACGAALRRMALATRAAGRTLFIVATPLHREWSSRYDVPPGSEASLQRRIGQVVQGTGAIVIDPGRPPARRAFFDAIHLRWSATPGLTKTIISRIYPTHA